jgi:hypothetical protein
MSCAHQVFLDKRHSADNRAEVVHIPGIAQSHPRLRLLEELPFPRSLYREELKHTGYKKLSISMSLQRFPCLENTQGSFRSGCDESKSKASS